jgi:hypothetical protein
MKEGELMAVPLLAEPPNGTQAIFICKVLVSRESYQAWKQEGYPKTHKMYDAAKVLPYLLVHVVKTMERRDGNVRVQAPDAAPIWCRRHNSFCRRMRRWLEDIVGEANPIRDTVASKV